MSNQQIAQLPKTDHGAVLYSLWLRTWQGASIFVTIPLLLRNLDSTNQGLYYLFLSIASAQAFFEMGLGLITTIRASHEWVNLRIAADGSVQGTVLARARLTKISRISLKFTLVAAIAFLTIAIIAGTQFLNAAETNDGSQTGAFVKYMALVSCLMVFNSMIYVVEGCNQVGSVAVFRLTQSIIGSITLWLSFQLGGGIDSLVFQASSTLLCSAAYIFVFRRKFFASIYLRNSESDLSWKKDFLPHQWRLATQSIFNLLSFPFFQFLSFKMLGPIESGKLGLTLQIALGVQTLSLVFISAKIPHLSMLAACGELTRLEREWKLQLTMSLAFMLAGFLVYIGGLSVIAWSFEIYYLRVLGIRETLIFFAGLLATTYIYGVASITRAHKVERFTKIGVCAGLGYSSMSAALCVHLGNLGIAFAYMTVTLLYVLPASYRMMNKFTEERKTV